MMSRGIFYGCLQAISLGAAATSMSETGFDVAAAASMLFNVAAVFIEYASKKYTEASNTNAEVNENAHLVGDDAPREAYDAESVRNAGLKQTALHTASVVSMFFMPNSVKAAKAAIGVVGNISLFYTSIQAMSAHDASKGGSSTTFTLM